MSHKHKLLLLSLLAHLATFAIYRLFLYFPPFDSSSLVLSYPLQHLRWDLFHFHHIGWDGYVYEHEWAFLPGPAFLNYVELRAKTYFDIPLVQAILTPCCLAALSFMTTSTLYDLSLKVFGLPSLAFLAASLSILPGSPATSRVALYAEPFFAFLSYKGMYFCTERKWIAASLCFLLATTFRSNGSLLSGFILYGMLIQPFLSGSKIALPTFVLAVILSASTTIPLVIHQLYAYSMFCSGAHIPDWCRNIPPLIYPHVQAKYWNVGFLKYWTLQQFPNFIIAAPPLMLILSLCARYFRNHLYPQKSGASLFPFDSLLLAPHIMHAFIFCCTLIFTSHVQIVLRVAASMPTTYWAGAWLFVDHPVAAKVWVAWCLLWGSISTALWAAFLPPA